MRKIILSMICLIGFSVQAQTITVNDARITQQTLDTAGASLTVETTGSIATTTDNAHGINVDTAATNAIVINNGTISTGGRLTHGINSVAADVSITNNGIITTTNPIAYGIFSSGANAAITHSGTITTTGSESVGIAATGVDSTITVSGRISATGVSSFAIHGGNSQTTKQTLNLEGNYDITGIIDLGGGTDTVNIKGIGAGTATSIVFHNVENIDYGMNLRLNVIDNGNTKTLTIDRTPTPTTTVNPTPVVNPPAGGTSTATMGNNGCTLNANTDKKPFDPTLPLLALLAGGYLLNRKLKYY